MIFGLTIAALVSGIITIFASLRANSGLQYVFKPLTMLAIIGIAFLNSSAPGDYYREMIIAGLILSSIGDIFLIESERFFIPGLLAFLLGHICYIAAFWTSPHWLSGLFYAVYAVSFVSILWKGLGRFKVPVIFYAGAIALMSWMALSKMIENHNHHTFHAFAGSLLFVVSDSLLAFNKFKSPIPLSPVWILTTYFAAQWLIAISV